MSIQEFERPSPIPTLPPMWIFKDHSGIEVYLPPCMGPHFVMVPLFDKMLMHLWNKGNPKDMQAYLYCDYLMGILTQNQLSREEGIMRMYHFIGTFGRRYGFFFLWKMAHKILSWKAGVHLIICAQALKMRTYENLTCTNSSIVDEQVLPLDSIMHAISLAYKVLYTQYN
jgi:hypothetical protein